MKQRLVRKRERDRKKERKREREREREIERDIPVGFSVLGGEVVPRGGEAVVIELERHAFVVGG